MLLPRNIQYSVYAAIYWSPYEAQLQVSPTHNLGARCTPDGQMGTDLGWFTKAGRSKSIHFVVCSKILTMTTNHHIAFVIIL